MKDPSFLNQLLTLLGEAKEKASPFTQLRAEQLNWKASEESWSIGQCLDHLVVSDCLYFPVLKKITEDNFRMSFWERWSPLGPFFGRMLANQMLEPTRKKKLKAPKVFAPSESAIDPGIPERFNKHLDTLGGYINACHHRDLDKIHISSPVSGFVTYPLRYAFLILVRHIHRHLSQAKRVKEHVGFPL